MRYLKKLTPGETAEEKLNEWGEIDEDAEYKGRKVKLNNPTKGDIKKFTTKSTIKLLKRKYE